MRARFLQLSGFSRRDGELRAHLAERLGDLQSEPARAAGDERNFSGEIEEFFYAHFCSETLVSVRGELSNALLKRPSKDTNIAERLNRDTSVQSHASLPLSSFYSNL